MFKKQSATTRSRNGSSKQKKSDSISESKQFEPVFFKEIHKRYENNDYLYYLIMISDCLDDRINTESNDLQNSDECLNSFSTLLNDKFKFKIDSKKGLSIEFKHYGTHEEFVEFIFLSFLGYFVAFRVDLEMLEKYNKELKGLNSFLLEEIPEIYKSYCTISKQLEFKTIILLGDNELPKEWQEINNPLSENEYDENKEILELDENFAIESGSEDHNLSSFTKGYKIINCKIQDEEDEEYNFFGPFLLLISGLGYKVKDENNESHQIDDILSSFNNLVGSKCKFTLGATGICFKPEPNENFEESEESGLLILLAIFACFRINLGYLESQNLLLKGLNEYLSRDFPEIYYGYCALSQHNGFDRTVNLGLNPPETPEEILGYLLNMKAEKWNRDITKPDIHLPATEVSDNTFLDTFDVPEVANIPAKKVGAKKPFRKRKSITTRNSRKSKKLFKSNQKLTGRMSSV